jgi:hypothetical protein
MNERPAWFVASLLAMIATLMIAHLAMLWVGVRECDEYAKILLERASSDSSFFIRAENEECSNVEETFADAVNQYLSVILSLLGGAAISGGIAMRAKREETGEKNDPRS